MGPLDRSRHKRGFNTGGVYLLHGGNRQKRRRDLTKGTREEEQKDLNIEISIMQLSERSKTKDPWTRQHLISNINNLCTNKIF